MLDAYWAACARDAEEGRNVYAGRRPDPARRAAQRAPTASASDRTRPGWLRTVRVDTASAAALQSVFDNGAPVAGCSWISDGELTKLVRTRASAARTGRAPRLLVDNLILTGDGRQAWTR